MNKKIKGYEVMKLIAEGQIKEGQEFLFTNANGVKEKISWNGENFRYFEDVNSFVLRTVSDIEFAVGDFEILEDEEEIDEEIDIETKLFEDIEMCLKRLSDFRLEAKPYVERYECDLEKYKTKKINKE